VSETDRTGAFRWLAFGAREEAGGVLSPSATVNRKNPSGPRNGSWTRSTGLDRLRGTNRATFRGYYGARRPAPFENSPHLGHRAASTAT
jgi:hypothetical protein